MSSRWRRLVQIVTVLLGAITASSATAQVIDSPGYTIYTFSSPGNVERTGLTVGRMRNLVVWVYGMRDEDGTHGAGTIFRMWEDGSHFEVLHEFGDPAQPDAGANPSGPLVEAADGIFYGVTSTGGISGGGTLFRLDTTVTPASVTTLYSFTPTVLPDEAPYGGVIVSRDSTPGHDVLFGTAGSPGLLYRIDTDGTPGGTLYQPICFTIAGVPHCTFGNGTPDDPGSQPMGLIEGGDGLLYGALGTGPDGDAIHGRVFRMLKDGSDFQVLAAAPGPIIGPPVEIESVGNRWFYVATGPGDASAPDGSIFRTLADGSVSEPTTVFDWSRLDVGSPPVGRLVAVPGWEGVYGLTSYDSGACQNNFGCGSVYRALGASAPFALKVFKNDETSRTPQGTPALTPNGRLLVMTEGVLGRTTIHVVNHPATEPLIVSGPSSVQTTLANFGVVSYQFSVAHRTGRHLPFSTPQVYVTSSGGLQLTSQSAGTGWTCVQLDPAFPQYRCTWSGPLSPGDTTPAHTMSFLVSPFDLLSADCGSFPAPCATFRADLDLASGGNTSDTVTTAVTVIHPNTGLPNTAPVGGDAFVTVYGVDATDVTPPVYSDPIENDILSYSIVSQPAYGSVSYSGNGRFLYTPTAPLTSDDTFEYRVTDTFGASDIGRVTLMAPVAGQFSLSKSLIDLGQVRAGEMATGRLSVLGPANSYGSTVFETLTPAEIAQVISANGLPYDPLAAVSDPDDFRPSSPGEDSWNTLSPTWVHYRAHPTVGRVSVIRAVFMLGLAPVGSAVLIGQSVDPVTGQAHAQPDVADTAVDTPVSVDVVANDVPSSTEPQSVGAVTSCVNYIEFLFDGAVCAPVPGAERYGVGPGLRQVTFEPLAGFSGISMIQYASGDQQVCQGSGSCRQETTLYWSTLTINVGGGTPPNLVATKAILNQFALVSAIEAVNGDTVVFRLGAINEPPSGAPASGPTVNPVTIADTLPVGLTFLAAGSDARCTAAGQVVTCTSAATLNQGDAVSFDIATQVTANPGPGNSVALYNEGVASTGPEITNADNISPYVQVMVRGPVGADLGVSIAAGDPVVPAGQPITVTATLVNYGPNDASNVVFSGFATLTGFDQVAVAPAGNCPVPAPGAPLVCTFPFLAVNAVQVVSITGTPQAANPLVQVSGTVSATETDPNTVNNNANASFIVTPAALPPNLRATKAILNGGGEVSSITVAEGAQVQFRIGAVNADASTAGSTTGPITVTDTLPAEFTSAVSLDGRCAVAGQTVTCVSTGVLLPGGSVAFDFVATTATGVAGDGGSLPVQNQATVTTPGDTTPADNVSPAVVVTILGPRRADLAVTMDATPTSLLVGETATFTATVTNNGPNEAVETRLRGFGALAFQFSIQSVVPAQGTCGLDTSGTQIECAIPDLAPGASTTVVVTATPLMRVFETIPDPQVNIGVSASVTTVTTDPAPLNNQAATNVTVLRPQADLGVTLGVSSGSVAVGQAITATATIVNNGPQPATLVDLSGFNALTAYGNLALNTTQGTCIVRANGNVGCDLGTLAPGTTAVVSVTATPPAPANSVLVSVRVSGFEYDPVEANDRAEATFAITNTPTGTAVTLPLTTATGAPVPVTVTFSAVTAGGQTVANPIASPPPVPGGFQIASVAYDISTTATFTPPVTVCIDGSFGAADSLLHYEGGAWVQLPNQQQLPVGGPFTRVCADTATFSPFVVATRLNGAPTVEAGPNQTLEATSPAGAVATVSATAADPDADALTYTWSGACGTASGATASLSCPLGTNLVSLSVSDGHHPAVTDTLVVTVQDTLAPTIAITSPGNNATYAVGQAVTAQFSCGDTGSGVQACTGSVADGAALPTDTPGTFTFTVDAIDNVGNIARRSVTYSVRAQTFAFEGFFWPVQNPPVVNKVKAGSAIPVRFGLGGDKGMNIFAPGFPHVAQVACGTGLPEGDLQDTVTAGKSGLIYNLFTRRYIYVWKTQKAMAGACWQLTLQFTDGTSASALFKMRR